VLNHLLLKSIPHKSRSVHDIQIIGDGPSKLTLTDSVWNSPNDDGHQRQLNQSRPLHRRVDSRYTVLVQIDPDQFVARGFSRWSVFGSVGSRGDSSIRVGADERNVDGRRSFYGRSEPAGESGMTTRHRQRDGEVVVDLVEWRNHLVGGRDQSEIGRHLELDRLDPSRVLVADLCNRDCHRVDGDGLWGGGEGGCGMSHCGIRVGDDTHKTEVDELQLCVGLVGEGDRER